MATILEPPARIDRSKLPEPQFSTGPIAGERYWSREFMEREWDSIWTVSYTHLTLPTKRIV